MRNIAYIRVSTNKQDTLNQKHRILTYTQERKILIDEFLEIEISSRKNLRDRKINELIDLLNNDDTLYVTELSRLGRNMLEVLNIINTLNEKNVKIVFINQPELSTSDNPALDSLKFAIYGFLAQSERDFISSRTKQGLENARAKGRILGHRKEFLKSKYDEYEEEIYRLRCDYGLPFSKICNMLDKDNSKGFKQQSIMNWFNRRYEITRRTDDKISKLTGDYTYTAKYAKHLEELKK